MGIDMYLEQSQLQSSSVATMCQSQVEAYQDLQSAIQKFSEDTESLKGDAYNSARSFFASVLLPLSKGGQLYAEIFSQAIKQGIDKKFPTSSQEFRDYIFLRVVGAANYNDFKWNETAGGLGHYFYNEFVSDPHTGQKLRTLKPILEIYQELGLKEEKAKELYYNLRLQHTLAGGGSDSETMKSRDLSEYNEAKDKYEKVYGKNNKFDEFWDSKLKAYSNNGAGHADFTHQSITMATHLNPNQVQLADVYGGRERVKDLSGWEGDTTFNANDMKPSIGEDDYKADLDSVNLTGRMQKGQSYDQAISSYYGGLQKDSSQREREFLKNKDWKQVKGTIYAGVAPADILRKGEASIKEYIEEKYPEVSTFLNRLEAVAD